MDKAKLELGDDPEKKGVGITAGKDGVYLASDLFSQYAVDGSLTPRQLIAPLLTRLLGERTLVTNLPASGKVALYEKNGNMVCHLLYANTVKRGDGVEIIEDIVTLAKVNVSIKTEKPPKKVVLQPTGEELAFTYEGGRVAFTVENFNCYQIVELV